jgi:hypothetical protein
MRASLRTPAVWRGRLGFWAFAALASCARLVGLDELRGAVDDPADSGAVPRREAGSGGAGAAGSIDSPVPVRRERDASGGVVSAPAPGAGAGDAGTLLEGFAVSVVKPVDAPVTVVSEPPGISCGAQCTARFAAGSVVTLTMVTENGAGFYPRGWSPELACTVQRDCPLPPLTGDLEVAAYAARLFDNLIFASSEPVSPTLGSAAAYDTICNELADRVGINSAQPDPPLYLAVMSDSASALRDRLTTYPSRWNSLDGVPFASEQLRLFENDVVHASVDHDERGRFVSDDAARRYITGTLPDGSSSADNCDDWSNPAAFATAGLPGGGPGTWIAGDRVSCAEPRYLLCMGTQKVGLRFEKAANGDRVWVSRERYVPGPVTPDEHCRAELPAGTTSARALVAHVGRAAGEQLSLGLDLDTARVDGTVVGTARQVATLQTRAGIWQTADGTYLSPLRAGARPDVWAGAIDFDTPGSEASTCNDWTGSTGSGITGRYDRHRRGLWGEADPATGEPRRSVPCDDPDGAHIYCITSPF